MKPFSCPEVDQNLWRYIDRELSASELASISFHLRGCESCQGLYHERARDASQYRMVFLDTPFGESFVAKVRKRMKAEGLYSMGKRPRLGVLSFHRRRLRRIVTVAAMLLLVPVVVVIGMLSQNQGRIELGKFLAQGGEVWLEAPRRSGRDEDPPGVPGTAGKFSPGDGIRVPDGTVAEIQLGKTKTRLTLEGPAFLRIEERSNASEFFAFLDDGALQAKVAKRQPWETFEISTPHAITRVLGTEFALEAMAGETVLSVSEGTVSFAPSGARAGSQVHVKRGEAYVVRAKFPQAVLLSEEDRPAEEAAVSADSPAPEPKTSPGRSAPDPEIPPGRSAPDPEIPPGRSAPDPGVDAPVDVPPPKTPRAPPLETPGESFKGAEDLDHPVDSRKK